jgi:hypothetical protein
MEPAAMCRSYEQINILSKIVRSGLYIFRFTGINTEIQKNQKDQKNGFSIHIKFFLVGIFKNSRKSGKLKENIKQLVSHKGRFFMIITPVLKEKRMPFQDTL